MDFGGGDLKISYGILRNLISEDDSTECGSVGHQNRNQRRWKYYYRGTKATCSTRIHSHSKEENFEEP
ncbi:hypothetical protein P8452_34264 [Trifolium repens]|nr:hypothetical protein P8452_34264 [Trifolium repens]